MRLLITGARGLLGLNLAVDACRSLQVTGVDRFSLVSAPFSVIRADLLERGVVDRMLDEAKPEAVIHCAAVADVDACERDPDLAQKTNAELPARLAAGCERRHVGLVQISTDAVFDGENAGAYTEDDDPNPRGVYARTKYEGEQAVQALYPGAIVARVNFYGWSLSGTRSLAEFFVSSLSRGEVVRGFTDVTFCPMLANQLGEILIKMLEAGLHGLYHVVGPQAMSKYEFGVAIARKFGLDDGLITPESVDRSGLAARRAHNLRLSTHKLSTDLGLAPPGFSTGLEQLYEQYQRGYPQKIRSYQQGKGSGSPASRPGRPDGPDGR